MEALLGRFFDPSVWISGPAQDLANAFLPSSNEYLPTDVPVRPIDLVNVAFDPDGGRDDPGPYIINRKMMSKCKDLTIYYNIFSTTFNTTINDRMIKKSHITYICKILLLKAN